jgi:hypothetical protein
VWEAQIDGRPLKFHLAGINNQNFIMRDEETGSWWQQVTGEAIHGPLKGRKLKQVFSDELTFAAWKRERPGGRVLRPDERVAKRYEPADWEERYAKLPVVTPPDPADPLPERTLVAGLTINGAAKAYPVDEVRKSRLILDQLGGTPVFLITGDDGKSVRAFERVVDGRTLEFFVKADESPAPVAGQLVDAETGSAWDFTGLAVSGPLAGKRLRKVPVLLDYWFDWKLYHPETAYYSLGARLKG